MTPEFRARSPKDRGHLDTRTALDYLEQRLDGHARRGVEEHLALPCRDCHERVRSLGLLLEHMRQDRTPDVTDAVRRRALDVFAPVERPSRAARLIEYAARLVFDSWSEAVPAATRRAVGEARRLRFALHHGLLELECEPESPGMSIMRGQLVAQDAALHRVEVEIGAEHLVAYPDTRGRFALEHVPTGTAHISVAAPSGRHRLPDLAL